MGKKKTLFEVTFKFFTDMPSLYPNDIRVLQMT